jgi:dihydrofolate synthase / folylpolyglutamate synthase
MSAPFREFSEVRDYLYGLKSHGAKYGIDRMRLLVERLGHPERRYPVIHVAGTNGKGSTVALLESIFRAAGYRTGMFTSPHLVYQGERVQVNREILPHAEIVRYTNELRPVAEDLGRRDPDDHPSFFEFMTAMALLRFAAREVDVALIETGLGGRLDATNVVAPALCVITSIGMDHMELLGDTLEAIAAEKAGILKAGVPVVLGALPAGAEAVIRARAETLGCPVRTIRERFGETLADYPECGLPGRFQRLNAATAVLAVETLAERFPVPPEALELGLRTVRWEGRWDRRVVDGRTLILDATHNEEGLVFLREQLASLLAETGTRPIVVTGMLGEHRAEALMPVIAAFAREIHLVRPKQPRACAWEALEVAIPADFTGPVHRTRLEEAFPAFGRVNLGRPGEVVVVTGSIYLLGEVLEAVASPVPVGESILQD